MKIFKRISKACLILDYFCSPIVCNLAFFLIILLLMIIPSIINAYLINYEQYITISSIYKYGIKIRDGASFPYMLFLPYVISYLLSMLSLCFKHVNRNVNVFFKIVVYLFFTSLFVVNIFCLLNYGTMMSPSIIMLIVETNVNEVNEFIYTYIFSGRSILAYLIIFIMIIMIIVSEKRINNIKLNRIFVFLLCLISLYMFQRSFAPSKVLVRLFDCEDLEDAELWYLDYPVNTNTCSNFIYSTYVMHLSKKEMGNAIKNTLAINQVVESPRNLDIVLVIGESFSKHHSSLYGNAYGLNTNPRLLNKVKEGSLFVFDNVVASYNLTSMVLRNLFSVNSIMDKENWADYPAFPMLFKKAGYNVYLWDNQRTFEKADVSDFSIAAYLYNDSIMKMSYTDYNREVFQYDGDLIYDFRKHVDLKSNRNLIIFHLMGQHTMPEKRYPKNREFIIFNKDSIDRIDLDEREKELIAQYENSTLYNDWVISEIIKQFEDRRSVMIYLSDHGEEIYDFRDHYGRTQEAKKTPDLLKYQYEIPFMIWCSNQYAEENPPIISNIKSAIHKPFMNDNVCQILMGLIGMKSVFYDQKRDLLSSRFIPYDHRIVQNTVNYDSIRFGK